MNPAHPDNHPWDFSERKDGILIRTRSAPGSDLRECYAEAVMDGTVAGLREVVSDVENFPKFMPYVKEGRVLGHEQGDITYTYVRIELPWPLSPRDYATKRVTDIEPDADGGGRYKVHWDVVLDKAPPARRDTIRMSKNSGYWDITAAGGGKVLVKHGFIVHPGGNVPMVAVNYANRTGLSAMFRAIAGEAKRRMAASKAATPKEPSPETNGGS